MRIYKAKAPMRIGFFGGGTDVSPYAEEHGDIGPLTRWIVQEACGQACTWSPSIQLGVNCTIHQLRRGEVSHAVATALEQTGFRSGQLTLEVTEDAIVDPAASADLATAVLAWERYRLDVGERP